MNQKRKSIWRVILWLLLAVSLVLATVGCNANAEEEEVQAVEPSAGAVDQLGEEGTIAVGHLGRRQYLRERPAGQDLGDGARRRGARARESGPAPTQARPRKGPGR